MFECLTRFLTKQSTYEKNLTIEIGTLFGDNHFCIYVGSTTWSKIIQPQDNSYQKMIRIFLHFQVKAFSDVKIPLDLLAKISKSIQRYSTRWRINIDRFRIFSPNYEMVSVSFQWLLMTRQGGAVSSQRSFLKNKWSPPFFTTKTVFFKYHLFFLQVVLFCAFWFLFRLGLSCRFVTFKGNDKMFNAGAFTEASSKNKVKTYYYEKIFL